MTEFVGTLQFLRIALWVAMENNYMEGSGSATIKLRSPSHVFSHSPHKLFFRTMFSHLGSPIEQFGTMNNLAPMINCPG